MVTMTYTTYHEACRLTLNSLIMLANSNKKHRATADVRAHNS